jgi:hypothetical protein
MIQQRRACAQSFGTWNMPSLQIHPLTTKKKGGENLAVVTSRGGVLLGKSANEISR